MRIEYRDIGVCGLSCRLCPRFHTDGPSRCTGCKGEQRMSAGCPFITCAVKRRGIEFCWDCPDSATCEKWAKHREAGRGHDSFVSYAGLDRTIECVQRDGFATMLADQEERGRLLELMLEEFNEGRSKSYYCVAATVLDVADLRAAVDAASRDVGGSDDPRERARALHERLDERASRSGVRIALRK